MRISKEWRVTWTFSYTYFEGKESYFDILLYVFRRDGELLGHYPMLILKERRVTWTFSYAYFEGTESYLNILLCVF
jgi:hypothetical protein